MGTIVPLLSLAATAAGGVMSAMGAYNQNQAAANAAAYNAKVASNAAQFSKQQGEIRAEAADRQTAALLGRQKAGFAAGGVDVNSGSPLDIQTDTVRFGRLNSLTIRNNAAREAWGYQSGANLQTAEAQGYQQAAPMAAAGSLIGTAGEVGGRYSQFRTAGIDPFAISLFS
jgi:hypothetical protein